MVEQRPSALQVYGPTLAVALLGLVLTLPWLGQGGLWDPWEPRYAQTAREMADGGHWVVPHYRGDPRLVKPPMTYWMIRASQSVLGVTETAARLPSALLAVLCPTLLALALAVGRRPFEGFLAGAALLTSPQWLLLGRCATPDAPFASFLGIALAAVLAVPALRGVAHRRLALAAAFSAIGLATLTEWPRGLVLPVWAVLGWAALRRGRPGLAALGVTTGLYVAGQQMASGPVVLASFAVGAIAALWFLVGKGRLGRPEVAVGVALLVVIVAPWFLAVFQAEPVEAADRLLGYKHGLNLGESVGTHTGPPYYTLAMVALGAMPWSAVALVGLLAAIIRRADAVGLVAAGATLGALLFFAGSASQMGHFYAVVQPPVAVLAGLGVVQVARRRLSLIPAGVALAVLTWLFLDEPSRLLETATVKTHLFGLDLVTPVVAATAVFAVLLVLASVRRRAGWAALAVAPAVAGAVAVALWAVPALTPHKTLRPLWERYVEQRNEGEELGTYGKAKDSIHYYSNLQNTRLRSLGKLKEFLALPGRKFVVMEHRDHRRLREAGLTAGEVLFDGHPAYRLVRYEPSSRRAAPPR